MSKVLIDRALLERVQERLDPHRDAVLWGAVCDTFHTAPSGTPAMPVKAYYHEAPNEYGGFNKSVGLEVRKAFIDAPLVLESDALTQIACLEGEIAKRGARIVELESQYQRDVCGLNNEGDPIGGDPAGGYANDNARLRAELAAIKAQEPVARLPACPSRAFAVANLRDLAQSVLQHDPDVGMFRDEDQAFLINELADLAESFNGDVKLYAAPVSEAKAQGVVMPEPMKRGDEGGSGEYGAAMIRGYNACLREVARLNAAPAAPAADAGIVDMYSHLQKVTPYRFKKIQDAAVTDGGDVLYFHKDRFDAALLDDMAAHCAAKGVV